MKCMENEGASCRWFLFVKLTVILILTVVTNVDARESVKDSVEMLCGDYKWVIKCGRDNTPKSEDSRECNMNKLMVTTLEGMQKLVSDPPITKVFYDDKRPVMIKGVTPTSMSCLSKHGKFYISIEYSRGCSTEGLFFDWFENSGTRLTSVGVPLKPGFKKPSEGLGWKQLPQKISIEEGCE